MLKNMPDSRDMTEDPVLGPKYVFTGETMRSDRGELLRQIRAVRDLPYNGVKKGDVGGWIAQGALSHRGDCWVAENAVVSGWARVIGNCLVTGNAQVYNSAVCAGDSVIAENAKVFGEAIVAGHATISGDADVAGTTFVAGTACIRDETYTERGIIAGKTILEGSCQLRGKIDRAEDNCRVIDSHFCDRIIDGTKTYIGINGCEYLHNR